MSVTKFKVGDHVKILTSVTTPFAGFEGIIHHLQPNDRGIETLDRHVVMFESREKRSFYGVELTRVPKSK